MLSPEDIARTLWGALTCGCPSHTEKAIVAALRVERDRFDALLDCVRAEAQCCGCSTRIEQRFDEERSHA